MVQFDNSNLAVLVQDKRSERHAYMKQWILWLGVGSAGGAISLISLSANLPDPDYAFHAFIPALWSFSVGTVMAGLCPLLASLQARAEGAHFAEAHNRDELNQAIRGLPEFFSAPSSMTEGLNKNRNELIEKSKVSHDRAEDAWKQRLCWRGAVIFCLSVSSTAFVIGLIWPLIYLSLGGTLIPHSG
jgi:hypothetical protein